ncbi:MAG: DUF4112 domain-containing protein [Microthrixaceae bacterium]
MIDHDRFGDRPGDEVLEPDEVIPAGQPLRPDEVQLPPFVDALAWVLDDWVRIPGLNRRVGLDGVIGMLPVVGDGAGLITSATIVLTAVQQGVSVPSIIRMVGNVVVDSALGALPFAGDAFDFVFKSNARNVRLMRADLTDPERTRRSSAAVIALSSLVVLALVAVTVAAAVASVFLMVKLVEALF